jgi:hypothetical protein
MVKRKVKLRIIKHKKKRGALSSVMLQVDADMATIQGQRMV